MHFPVEHRDHSMNRVLVIEDHQNLLRSLRRGLEAHGYEVLVADTGEEGFQLATTHDVDIVILDVMLPGKNGFEVLCDLRAARFLKPVLILTAKDSPDDRRRGKLSGADAYLAKPFGFADVLTCLNELLQQTRTGLRAEERQQ
jgi:DNA-binding response OmpR family regulator